MRVCKLNMDLENRIKKLEQANRNKLAHNLIQGVISSSNLQNIEYTLKKEKNLIFIYHKLYTGKHKIKTINQKRKIERQGQYIFTGKNNTMKKEVKASNQQLIKKLEEKLNINSNKKRIFRVSDINSLNKNEK